MSSKEDMEDMFSGLDDLDVIKDAQKEEELELYEEYLRRVRSASSSPGPTRGSGLRPPAAARAPGGVRASKADSLLLRRIKCKQCWEDQKYYELNSVACKKKCACKICGKRFTQSSNLTRHHRIHNGKTSCR